MNKPRNKAYKPRLISIPVTGLHQEFALHAHAALFMLGHAPSNDSFDALAGMLNLIQVAIENDVRFIHEAKLISGGAMTLNQIARKVAARIPLKEHEFASLRVAVNAVDAIFTRLDVSRLYVAQTILRDLQAGHRPSVHL